MSESTFDVVIVGAGVAGAIVARQLAESGKSVLILEAGPDTGLVQGGFRSFVQHYYTEIAKVPNAPYPHTVAAPAPSVLDAFSIPGLPPSYFVQTGAMKYGSDYARFAGGTTLHWLGTCLRMLPNDFRLQSRYGVGVDWPIGYDDLQPYYEKAEWEIGVAANVEDQSFLPEEKMFREGYQFPMKRVPLSYWDNLLASKVNGLEVGVFETHSKLAVVPTPAGRNAEPHQNVVDPRYPHRGKHNYIPIGDPDDPDERGQRCVGHSSCVPICPVQAKYSALKTLRQAIDLNQERIKVICQAVASEIEFDRDSGRVTAIRYKRYEDPLSSETTEHRAVGKVFVIAAHAIETAKLLLASDAANSSGLVGLNLMDHPYLLTWGLMPEPIGSYRGPGSTSGIPQMRDGEFRSKCAAFLVEVENWGWSWPRLSPYSTVDELVDTLKEGGIFGKELREEVAYIGRRQFRFGFGMEQLPDPQNRVTIDQKYRDAIGNYRPVINYNVSDYSKQGMVEAFRISQQIFTHISVKKDYTKYNPQHPNFFTWDDLKLHFEAPGHGAGTHRMGTSRHDSVVNPDQRTWDHENLYLVGCGNFPTVGTSNPTLTLAALAFMASEKIIRKLR